MKTADLWHHTNKLAVLGLGVLLGVLAVAGVRWLQVPPTRPLETAAAPADVVRVGLATPAIASASVSTSPSPATPAAHEAMVTAGACSFDPMLPAQDARDGRYDAGAALAMPQRPPAPAFVVAAREAVAQQRWRDAEVALIVACRLVSQSAPDGSVPVADAQARLAQFYADYARQPGAGDAAMGATERARELLSASGDDYARRLGRQASKTQLAQRRLAALDASQPLPERDILAGGAGDPAAGTATMGGSPELAANDPALAQLASDLSRLRAQAQAVSGDPAGFQRRAAQARARLEACTDVACQRHWYAQRRAELLGEF